MPSVMRVLLSAFDCDPFAGSEAGVGWNWAMELGAEHEVVVLTREHHRAAIEASDRPLPPGLRFEFFDDPSIERRLRRVPLRPYLYYRAWQSAILPLADRLHRRHRFEVAQHITWGAWRQPSHLHRLGLPLIFGPVGGGESTPRRLRRSLDARRRVNEVIRDAANVAPLLSPHLWQCLDRARLIVCRTDETRSCIPRRYWPKTHIRREIGIAPARIQAKNIAHVEPGRLKVLFVGRLLGWKGIHLAIKAFARLAQAHPDTATFDVVGGKGDYLYREKLQAVVQRAGLGSRIRLIEWLPHHEVQALYGEYDAFLFPSFRDSGGTVVLESMAAGLPVVCLDLGGPPRLLGGKAGIVVPARNRSEAEVVDDLAAALERLFSSPDLLRRLRIEANQRASEVTWGHTVREVYDLLDDSVLGSA